MNIPVCFECVHPSGLPQARRSPAAYWPALLVAVVVLLSSCGNASNPAKPVGSGPAPTPIAAQVRPESHVERPRSARGKASPEATGTSGTFDYYVMSLSWSPGYCATPVGQRDQMQCAGGRQYGFVLHGLWPQYETRRSGAYWPEDCTTERVPDSTITNILDIMPSRNLVIHEWRKHGTCSGLAPQDYFDEAREAFGSVKIPAQYQAPLKQITVDPARMLQAFAEANPKFGPSGFAVLCSNNGRFLQEVRACLRKDLTGKPCTQDVLRDQCGSSEMIMRPVR